MLLALVISNAIVAAAAVVTLIVLLLRLVLSVERRLANLETKIEPLWDAVHQIVVARLQGTEPGGNPMSSERWQYPLSKLQKNTLLVEEARELNAAFLEQQETAKKRNDWTLLIALGLGLALLAPLLKEK